MDELRWTRRSTDPDRSCPLPLKHLYLALAITAALPAAIPSAAESGVPAPPSQVLPDLRQAVPDKIGMSFIGGAWRLGFDSKVHNDGPGYLRIRGTGPGDETMVADQIIQMSDGTTTTLPAVGALRYVRSPVGAAYPHNHFHFLDFERYELRLPDSGQTLVKDEKTGFCLADAFTTDLCGRNHPELASLEEGLSAGSYDLYTRNVEGQYITLDPVTVPAGDYLLVHRVNPTGAFAEANPANDVASVRIQIKWSSGDPSATVTNKCAASVNCPAPPPGPDPLPDPEPPQPQPAVDPEPIAAASAPVPETVPILSPAEFTRRAEQATMSREMAGRLVRRAIQKSVKETPQKLRTKCARRSRHTFACSASWTGSSSAASWTGKVRVWYDLKNGRLSWFYDLSATRRPGGKRVVAQGAQGSASSSLFAGPAASMVCGRVELG